MVQSHFDCLIVGAKWQKQLLGFNGNENFEENFAVLSMLLPFTVGPQKRASEVIKTSTMYSEAATSNGPAGYFGPLHHLLHTIT